jgi:2'-5' RNA ligase
MIRSFVGLPLPAQATRALEALQNGLPAARAVPAEDMHLTLAFLDDQPEAVLRALAEDLGDMKTQPFEIRLSGISLLGGKQPGAIAVNADGGPALVALQARVARTIRRAGINLERRRFKPHVTIFRLSRRLELTETSRIQDWIGNFACFSLIVYPVERMTLYQSRLSRAGASYDVLAEFPFETRGI